MWGTYILYRLAAFMVSLGQILSLRFARSRTASAMSRVARALSEAASALLRAARALVPSRPRRPLSSEMDAFIRRLTEATQRGGDETVLRAFVAKLAEELPEAMDAAAGDSRRRDNANLIREIAHSLNTPIALIEAAALRLDGSSDATVVADIGNKVLAAAGVCKAFLNGYRELYTLGLGGAGNAPESLAETISDAIDIYAVHNGKAVVKNIVLPARIPGYSTSYLVAALLPLVQNAIEASPDRHSMLTVQAVPLTRRFALRVQNDNDGEGAMPIFSYDSVTSTKDGHEGLGLTTVMRLIEPRTGSMLTHRVDDKTTTFEILFPGGLDRED